ncbi:MAG: glycosyltransferase family 39 protein [Cyclobacteriaceae bacterium]|nr:glycosyltransferase family 39 protein [Cyclobacteriaceae bacterium]
MKRIPEKYYPYLIALAGVIFFLPFLGKTHLFDWDEINFAESAREMLVTGDYFRVRVGFLPFWEKPPFFFWLQAASMKLFGVNEFAARFPNAVFGIITLLTLYFIGKKERNSRFGLIWALLFFGSILPHMYFKSGIIDPVFNYFIFTAIYFLMLAFHKDENKLRNSAISGALIGLAVITKGPVGFLLLLLTFLVVLVVYRFKKWPRLKDVLVFALATFVVTFAWYGAELIEHGPWFLVEFIKYQIELFSQPVAGHEQPIYYHFVVVFLGCFPMSVLALGSFNKKTTHDNLMAKWMMTLFWVVMILFTIVTTKIVHYSSMAYLPLSFLATLYIDRKLVNDQPIPKGIVWTYLILGIIFGILLTALPLVVYFIGAIKPYINDPFAVVGLMKPVNWSGYEFLIGLFFIVVVIVSAIGLFRNKILRSIGAMGFGVGLTLLLYSIFVLPKIEQHTQGSLVDFLISKQGEDVYVITSGFHSYAPYFYFRQPDNNLEKRADKNWLITGEIDKPVYIISKITDTYLPQRPDLQLLKEEGGFRFYYRPVKSE